MAALSENHKLIIILMLAQFRSPASVVAHMREEQGVEVNRWQVRSYDPTSTHYEAGDRWRAIFNSTRETYLRTVEAVPIAHQAYRLNMLQRGLEEATRRNNWPLVLKTLEQAAKEVGGALTNESSLKVSNPIDSLTPEERRHAFEELIRKALDSKHPLDSQPAPPAIQ